jgi:hypothetical protein
MAVDKDEWREEASRNAEFLARFGDRLPIPLRSEHRSLVRRLGRPRS